MKKIHKADMMETMVIRAVLTAIKEKSLSRAAEKYAYTPSALTHMADRLEDELGVKLLERTRAGVSLTQEGEELLAELIAVLDAESALRSAATRIRERKSEVLRIGTYASIAANLLPEIIKHFKKVHPNIKVCITVCDDLRMLLKNNQADVVFGSEFEILAYTHKILLEEPYVAIVPDNMFVGRKAVTREELYDYTYISISEDVLHEYFDESRFKEVLTFDSVDDSSVISLVKESIGVAVLPKLAVKKLPKGVRALRLAPKITRAIGFAFAKPSPPIRCFVDFLEHSTFFATQNNGIIR